MLRRVLLLLCITFVQSAFIMPSYVGVNFYSKNLDYRLVNIMTGGLLYIINTDKNIKSLKDLKGKKIIMPFKNDMPDLVLRFLLQKAGIAKRDWPKLEYVTAPKWRLKAC